MTMTKALTNARKSLPVLAGIALVWAGSAHAASFQLSAAQMDSVAAAGVQQVDGFVCPVITTAAVLNSPHGMMIAGGHYTIIGPDVSIPVHATNANGAGSPAGAHAQPGDRNYTAIWAK